MACEQRDHAIGVAQIPLQHPIEAGMREAREGEARAGGEVAHARDDRG